MKQLIVLLALSTLGLCQAGIEGVATGKRFLEDGKLAVGMNYWGSKWATQMWSRHSPDARTVGD